MWNMQEFGIQCDLTMKHKAHETRQWRDTLGEHVNVRVVLVFLVLVLLMLSHSCFAHIAWLKMSECLCHLIHAWSERFFWLSSSSHSCSSSHSSSTSRSSCYPSTSSRPSCNFVHSGLRRWCLMTNPSLTQIWNMNLIYWFSVFSLWMQAPSSFGSLWSPFESCRTLSPFGWWIVRQTRKVAIKCKGIFLSPCFSAFGPCAISFWHDTHWLFPCKWTVFSAPILFPLVSTFQGEKMLAGWDISSLLMARWQRFLECHCHHKRHHHGDIQRGVQEMRDFLSQTSKLFAHLVWPSPQLRRPWSFFRNILEGFVSAISDVAQNVDVAIWYPLSCISNKCCYDGGDMRICWQVLVVVFVFCSHFLRHEFGHLGEHHACSLARADLHQRNPQFWFCSLFWDMCEFSDAFGATIDTREWPKCLESIVCEGSC